MDNVQESEIEDLVGDREQAEDTATQGDPDTAAAKADSDSSSKIP